MNKPGVVYGFVTMGQRFGKTMYRFGCTKKTQLDERYAVEDRQWVLLDGMFQGLNKPVKGKIVFFEQVTDVVDAWDIVREWLRHHSPRRTKGLEVSQETMLGDRFFSLNITTERFAKHLEDLKSEVQL